MTATLNDRAIQGGYDLIQFMTQLRADLKSAQLLSERITKGNFEGVWNVLPTYAVNSDGTAGQTDTTPVTTHPTAIFNVSPNDMSIFANTVNDFISFMTNGTPTQSDRESVIATDLG